MNIEQYKARARDVVVAENNGNDDICVHRVKLPLPGEKGWYPANVSAQAFHQRMLKKYFGEGVRQKEGTVCPKGRWFSFTWAFEYDNDLDSWKRFHKEKVIPVIIHESIWDFYGYIKFNHKKNKFCGG